MKKTILTLALLTGMLTSLPATIITIPASGVTNVGGKIGFQTDCYDYYTTDTWLWGDGQTYTCQSDYPAYTVIYHTYRNPGTYQVHVHRPITTTCLDDEYRIITVNENRSITVSPAQPSLWQPITFTAVNFQTPANITWDMGDGTTYAHRNNVVTHTYTKAGSFTVRAFDWNGDTKTMPVSLALVLTRGISFSPEQPRVDEPVEIRAISFNSDSIDWNFGDGTPLQTYSPLVSHRFQNPGAFTITAREHNMDLPAVSKVITILPENRSLVLSVQEARTDEPVTITALNFRGPLILWDFGDGTTVSGPASAARASRPASAFGSATITHAYKLPGNYTITARDENGASEKRFQAFIRILGISDQVNLEIAEITLDNGKYYKVVPKNSKNIRAQLKMKLRGTGIVSGYWIIDNQPYQFFNETVYQGQIKTILTQEVPGLPVFDPGMHTVTVQLTRPASQSVVFPTLRYYVLPYENEIVVLSPKDGAIIKEDRVAEFAWESAMGGSYYQLTFANSVFPLMRNEENLKWLDCPERFRFTPDAGTWSSIKRNEWTYWKVRAMDSGRAVVAESGVMEMKIILPGAKVGIEKITDMDGMSIAIGSDFTTARDDHLLIHGTLTYPGDAEYLILQVYANDSLVDRLLFREVRKDVVRLFQTAVPNMEKESRVIFEVLKSSSPSIIIGFLEIELKHE